MTADQQRLRLARVAANVDSVAGHRGDAGSARAPARSRALTWVRVDTTTCSPSLSSLPGDRHPRIMARRHAAQPGRTCTTSPAPSACTRDPSSHEQPAVVVDVDRAAVQRLPGGQLDAHLAGRGSSTPARTTGAAPCPAAPTQLVVPGRRRRRAPRRAGRERSRGRRPTAPARSPSATGSSSRGRGDVEADARRPRPRRAGPLHALDQDPGELAAPSTSTSLGHLSARGDPGGPAHRRRRPPARSAAAARPAAPPARRRAAAAARTSARRARRRHPGPVEPAAAGGLVLGDQHEPGRLARAGRARRRRRWSTATRRTHLDAPAGGRQAQSGRAAVGADGRLGRAVTAQALDCTP